MSALSESQVQYQSLGRNNDVGLSCSAVYDPILNCFRIMTTQDFVNINLLGSPTLTTIYPFSTNISNSTPFVGVNNSGVLLAPSTGRKGFYIQNLTTGMLYVLLNTGSPSTGNFNILLTSYQTFQDQAIRYSGQVSATGSPTMNVMAWNY